jgi:isocitrate/isopropylmalate dehydrogenase
MLQRWKRYCNDNDATVIPKLEFKLSNWEKDTRNAYKKYTNKLTTTMTEERLAQLTEANFPFQGYVGTPTTTKLKNNPVQTMAVKKVRKSITPKNKITQKLPKVRTTAKKSTNTEKSQKHILHRG